MNDESRPLLIVNAHLFDPSNGLDEKGDVYIEDGLIAAINPGEKAGVEIFDAKGKCLFPSFCDVHVHFRTPGQTHKEDIDSGSMAALAGGFTSVIQMPNTNPVIDTPELVRSITRNSPIDTYVLAAITEASGAKVMNDLKSLQEAGAPGFTDDGRPVTDPEFMKKALEFSAETGCMIASHSEDFSVGEFGAIRPGEIADELGVRGWAPERESNMVGRDCQLAIETGGHLQVCHISATQSVEFVRKAKSEGVNVTAEVTPHHLVLTVDAVIEFGTNAKMNPPLGTEKDRQVLIEALKDGTIDCVATDHAPHSPEEKFVDLGKAPYGVIGLETSFPVCYTHLVKTGRLSLSRLIEAMAIRPREIYSLPKIGIYEKSPADLTLADLENDYVIDQERFYSKSKNCPFAGEKVLGKILMTFHNGIIQYRVDG